MISPPKNANIVLLEKTKSESFSYHLKISDYDNTILWLNQYKADPDCQLYVDCDDDCFLASTELAVTKDKYISIWKGGKVLVSDSELNRLLTLAPELFPFLAVDESGQELMLAWGKRVSLEQALQTGIGTYFSRSRNKPWIKGEESGHLQNLKEIYISQDPYYIMYRTDQKGAACHTGYYSCFFRKLEQGNQVKLVYNNKVGE
ncbi:phosphoribosyl-AMP cyclohydrolase [Leptospira ilyithenensis]|uniref:phosphoribosyl-AMP cyclohydrolase n=1 Tax=Leptospira ilyithenensis TaxID=2484901 RepID=A0A4R9LQ22_9LEPT|nr:phosphoribosyl-AMP cyclohydrolase [Leptospira ilyithenensis]TGN11121.1 phosphoribosyl-AMP cyclohydrolase [Leptospira ilyithenensis]